MYIHAIHDVHIWSNELYTTHVCDICTSRFRQYIHVLVLIILELQNSPEFIQLKHSNRKAGIHTHMYTVHALTIYTCT